MQSPPVVETISFPRVSFLAVLGVQFSTVGVLAVSLLIDLKKTNGEVCFSSYVPGVVRSRVDLSQCLNVEQQPPTGCPAPVEGTKHLTLDKTKFLSSSCKVGLSSSCGHSPKGLILEDFSVVSLLES